MSRLFITMGNAKNVIKKIERLKLVGRSEIERLVAQSTVELHGLAVKGIQEISPGERTTRRASKGAGKGSTERKVTVSKPGDPPNTDTGRAISSVLFGINLRIPQGQVGTNLVYLAHLEFGTKTIAARPWLSSAYAEFLVDKFNKLTAQTVKAFKKVGT